MFAPQSFYKAQAGTPVVGTMYSQWVSAGIPGAGTIPPTGTISGQFYTCVTTQVTGQLTFINPPAGDTIYLTRFSGAANVAGTLILADRIWGDSLSPLSNTGNSVQAAAAIWSGSFPRSAGIGGGDSSGTGLCMAMEVYTSMGGTASTPKVTYINSSGNGDTAVLAYAMPASAVAGTFIPFNLAQKTGAIVGNFGVRSVSAFHQFATKSSGVWGITVYRPLAYIPCSVAGVAGVVDALTSGFPIMFPNTVPMIIWMAGTVTVPVIAGQFAWAMG